MTDNPLRSGLRATNMARLSCAVKGQPDDLACFLTPYIGHQLTQAKACITKPLEPAHLTAKRCGVNDEATTSGALWRWHIDAGVHQAREHDYLCSTLGKYNEVPRLHRPSLLALT